MSKRPRKQRDYSAARQSRDDLIINWITTARNVNISTMSNSRTQKRMNGFLELIFTLSWMLGNHLFFEYCIKGKNQCHPLFFLHDNSGTMIEIDRRVQWLSASEKERKPCVYRQMEVHAVTCKEAFKNSTWIRSTSELEVTVETEKHVKWHHEDAITCEILWNKGPKSFNR